MAGLSSPSDDRVPPQVEVVTSPTRAKQICGKLMKGEQVISMGCKAKNLGPKAPLSLVQIGTVDGQVYMFDVLDNYNLFTDGRLGDLLEAENVEKVIHLCGPMCGALYSQGKTNTKNIFDTHVADLLVEMMVHAHFSANKVKDVLTLARKYEGPAIDSKILKGKDRRLPWNSRPLTYEMMERAATEVRALVPAVYCKLWGLLDDHSLWEDFNKLVGEEKFRAIRLMAAISRDGKTIRQNIRDYCRNKVCQRLKERLSQMELPSQRDLRPFEMRLLLQMPTRDVLGQPSFIQNMHTQVCDYVLKTTEEIMVTEGERRDDTLCGLDDSIELALQKLTAYNSYSKETKERAGKVLFFIQQCKLLKLAKRVLKGAGVESLEVDQRLHLYKVGTAGMSERDLLEIEMARQVFAGRFQSYLLQYQRRHLMNVQLLSKSFQQLLLTINQRLLVVNIVRQARERVVKGRQKLKQGLKGQTRSKVNMVKAVHQADRHKAAVKNARQQNQSRALKGQAGNKPKHIQAERRTTAGIHARQYIQQKRLKYQARNKPQGIQAERGTTAGIHVRQYMQQKRLKYQARNKPSGIQADRCNLAGKHVRQQIQQKGLKGQAGNRLKNMQTNRKTGQKAVGQRMRQHSHRKGLHQRTNER